MENDSIFTMTDPVAEISDNFKLNDKTDIWRLQHLLRFFIERSVLHGSVHQTP